MRDLGNTVLVVEHDEETIRAADWVDRPRARRRHPRRRGGRAGRRRRSSRRSPRSLTGALPRRRADDPGAGRAPPRQRQADRWCAAPGEQPQGDRRRVPARHADLRHRRLRLGQVDARQRDPLQGARPACCTGARPARARTTRIEGVEHLDKVIDIDQSPDRPHAALEPGDLHQGLRPDPRAVRADRRRRGRAATSRGASPSTSRAAAARRARATARSRSRCTSCPTSTSPARSAGASATTARRSRSATRG